MLLDVLPTVQSRALAGNIEVDQKAPNDPVVRADFFVTSWADFTCSVKDLALFSSSAAQLYSR